EGPEQPERGPLQPGPVAQTIDAVPGEHALEPPPVARREAGTVRVEPPEELEHVLLGARLVVEVRVPEGLCLGAWAVEDADVREEVEERVLAAKEVRVGRVPVLDPAPVGGPQSVDRPGVQVEAE